MPTAAPSDFFGALSRTSGSLKRDAPGRLRLGVHSRHRDRVRDRPRRAALHATGTVILTFAGQSIGRVGKGIPMSFISEPEFDVLRQRVRDRYAASVQPQDVVHALNEHNDRVLEHVEEIATGKGVTGTDYELLKTIAI